MTVERWVPVPGYRNYEVSDLGRVRSWHRKNAPQVLAQRTNGCDGYMRVNLYESGANTNARVHRLVLAAFVGPCPAGQEVRHRDGTADNNALSNLHYGTRAENAFDAVRHGTHSMARKTMCLRGHPFDESNTYHRPDKPHTRECRACRDKAAR
jgi:hypothetical protein